MNSSAAIVDSLACLANADFATNRYE